MSTPIQPVPPLVLASEFPSLADRPAGTYNAKAKAWADTSVEMAENLHETAENAHNNAVAAEERAQLADQRATDAESAKQAAEDARDKAQDWAEGVEPSPGSKSAKGWAGEAETYKNNAEVFASAAGAAAGIPAIEGNIGKALIVAPGDTPGDPPKAVWGDTDGKPGEVRISQGRLTAPKWLRCGGSYLRDLYPITWNRMLSLQPNQNKASGTSPTAPSTKIDIAVSPDKTRLVLLTENGPEWFVAYNISGAWAKLVVSHQPVDASRVIQNNNFRRSFVFSTDSQYLLVCVFGVLSSAPSYQKRVMLYKRTETGYQYILSVYQTEDASSSGAPISAAFSPDKSQIYVLFADGVLTYSFDEETETITGGGTFPVDTPTSGIIDLKFTPGGGYMVVSRSGGSLIEPSYAIYKRNEEGLYIKQTVPNFYPTASPMYSMHYPPSAISADGTHVFASMSYWNVGSAYYTYGVVVNLETMLAVGGTVHFPYEAKVIDFLGSDYRTLLGLGGQLNVLKLDETRNVYFTARSQAVASFTALRLSDDKNVMVRHNSDNIQAYENAVTFEVPHPLNYGTNPITNNFDYAQYVRSYD